MRAVLNVLARRMMPWTSYPFSRSSSARYDPSCPVIPVISAFVGILNPEFRILSIFHSPSTPPSYPGLQAGVVAEEPLPVERLLYPHRRAPHDPVGKGQRVIERRRAPAYREHLLQVEVHVHA